MAMKFSESIRWEIPPDPKLYAITSIARESGKRLYEAHVEMWEKSGARAAGVPFPKAEIYIGSFSGHMTKA